MQKSIELVHVEVVATGNGAGKLSDTNRQWPGQLMLSQTHGISCFVLYFHFFNLYGPFSFTILVDHHVIDHRCVG